MSESHAWSLTMWVLPFVSPVVAYFLAHRGLKWGWTIRLSVIAALGWLLLMNLVFEKPDEWALVLLVSIPWWPILLGGAVLGTFGGKLSRDTDG
jgi:hypothetical protein